MEVRRETAETFSERTVRRVFRGHGERGGEGEGEGEGGRPQRRAGSEQVTGSSAPSSAVPRHGRSRSARRPAFGFVSHATDFSMIFYAPLPSPPFLQPRCPFDTRSFSATSSFSSVDRRWNGYYIGDYINSLMHVGGQSTHGVLNDREREIFKRG